MKTQNIILVLLTFCFFSTVFVSEFPAGIYLYALIADGNQIDVKRMILTE